LRTNRRSQSAIRNPQSAMRKILPNLYTFTGLGVGRVYLVEDADGLTLIDTSISSAPAKILRQLEDELGRGPEDIKRILITHAHPDHVGGLPELVRLTGAQVYVSEGERAVAAGEAPMPRPAPEQRTGIMRVIDPPEMKFPPVQVDRVVRDGDVLPEVMGGLHVIATPGHAPGHVAYWHPEQRVLFAGDVIMSFWPARLRLPVAMFTYDMDENIRSIGRLAELDTRVLCLGHGIPLARNAAETIRAFAREVGASGGSEVRNQKSEIDLATNL
jgi:glyoxylase-like metal-dependent hydrolase (beta-lactamase superfamily II)